MAPELHCDKSCSIDVEALDITCAVCQPPKQLLSLDAVKQCGIANNTWAPDAITHATREDIKPTECGGAEGFLCHYKVHCELGMIGIWVIFLRGETMWKWSVMYIYPVRIC